ncbi:cytochrome P450 94A2-like [Nicotiana tomentosiformis]|uniref:cytochrome P450 94A2-like n=1 Tax=Nicotiana tomentosiformis TaxID=4098 RepID=UPI00388C5E89
MRMDIQLMYSLLFSIPVPAIIFLLLLFFIYFHPFFSKHSCSKLSKQPKQLPKSDPLFGCLFSLVQNRHRAVLWTSELFQKSSLSTITLKGPFGKKCVLTRNPSIIKHIVKTRFHIYRKDPTMQFVFSDLLGDGLLLVDGEKWKTQRHFLSHIFHADTFRYRVKSSTIKELSGRLIPLFSRADIDKATLDLQDIFHRLTFDILCQVGFSHDPEYLLPSLPEKPLIDAFETAIKISMRRFTCPSILWKAKKLLNIGSEENLRYAVDVLREYVKKRIAGKVEKFSMQNSSIDEGGDFFDRFITRALKYNVVVDEKFVIDTGINFILAGDDTLFSALIWFFWLVSSHPQVEKEIVKEIEKKDDDDLNEMVYTHASIWESMRLYPPVPLELKQVTEDDVWPDGTKLKKGMTIFLHVLAMGRSTELWGSDCEVFRPERWLLKNSTTGNWNFIPRNPFTYPIFQAGPKTCLGKEIAFMQINLVAATILKRFQIVPLDGFSPIYNSSLTSKMKTGFHVRIIQRC